MVLCVLCLLAMDSFAGGKGSGQRGHTTPRFKNSREHHSSESLGYSGVIPSDFSQSNVNFIQQNTDKTQLAQENTALQTAAYDVACYVCKTKTHPISFQDMPCGYYEINKD